MLPLWMRRERRQGGFGGSNLLRHAFEERTPGGGIAESLQVINECEKTFEVNDRFVAIAFERHPGILFRTPSRNPKLPIASNGPVHRFPYSVNT
jgi:hypothetical protein